MLISLCEHQRKARQPNISAICQRPRRETVLALLYFPAKLCFAYIIVPSSDETRHIPRIWHMVISIISPGKEKKFVDGWMESCMTPALISQVTENFACENLLKFFKSAVVCLTRLTLRLAYILWWLPDPSTVILKTLGISKVWTCLGFSQSFRLTSWLGFILQTTGTHEIHIFFPATYIFMLWASEILCVTQTGGLMQWVMWIINTLIWLPKCPPGLWKGLKQHNEFIFRFYVLQHCKHMSISPAIWQKQYLHICRVSDLCEYI